MQVILNSHASKGKSFHLLRQGFLPSANRDIQNLCLCLCLSVLLFLSLSLSLSLSLFNARIPSTHKHTQTHTHTFAPLGLRCTIHPSQSQHASNPKPSAPSSRPNPGSVSLMKKDGPYFDRTTTSRGKKWLQFLHRNEFEENSLKRTAFQERRAVYFHSHETISVSCLFDAPPQPRPYLLNREPMIPSPHPSTLNPQPSTLNP